MMSTRALETASRHPRMDELKARVRWLEEERERLSLLVDAVPVAFVLLDDNGQIKLSNREFEKMLGFRRGLLNHVSFSRLVLQPDVPVFLDHVRRCRISQEAVTSEIRLRNGRHAGLPVELISQPASDQSDPPGLYRTAVMDLTRRRVTEQRLADTTESFRSLLDTAEGIVWELDGESLEVTFVSRYAEKMLGYPLTEWFQPGFWERHIYVDDREQVIQEVSRTLRERTNATLEYRVMTADRKLLWIHDRIGVRVQGGKTKLLGIAVDITTQKETEKELQNERINLEQRVAERTAQLQTTISELEAFSYSLSHDMRAPLRAMEGYTQLLRNILSDKLGPKELDFFGRIMASAERLDNLIQDVLQYSRVARAPLELREVDLEKILAQVISDYPTLQPPSAEIQIQKPLLRVRGHEAFLTQCISNLLSNAVKFVAPGVSPKVIVYTKPFGEDVRLVIEDNGIGIPFENQKQIFGIFQRLHANTIYPGTGIGLAIVQKAVERMGGRAGVESGVGKGSRFWLQLKRPEKPARATPL